MPVLTGQVVSIRYLKHLSYLAFGALDGFFSVVQLTPEDIAKKCSV